jgi:hypothetical protein
LKNWRFCSIIAEILILAKGNIIIMIRKSVFVLLLFFSVLLPVFSNSAANNGENEDKFIIRNISYTIVGKTRENVLSHYLDIKSGESFPTEEDLTAFLEDKLQLISNQRTLAEGNIETTYSRDPKNPGRNFVDLEVYVKDTWNYLILPYPKYDSNTGFLLSLRGRNYNFLGTMETLSLNLDILMPNWTMEDWEYSINGGFALPFYLWGYNWKFSFDENITRIPINTDDPGDPDELLKLNTHAGITMDIPLDSLTWQASVDQYLYINKDGGIDTVGEYVKDADGYYMKTAASFGSSIPTGFDLPLLGELSYSPGIITSFAYKPFDSLSEDRKGYELGGKHGVSAGRINWHGNFRDGASLSADQDLRYNFTTGRWLSNQNAEFQFHKSFGWGGVSSRLKGFSLYNSTSEDIGAPIRGILNDRLDGDAAVFLNLDFPVKIWIWFLDRWFEGHISPFFDYALVKPKNGDFSLDKGWYGAGIEGFAFLKAARSIYLRMSLGVDLEAMLDGALPGDPAPRDGASIYTLFIGLGHHY